MPHTLVTSHDIACGTIKRQWKYAVCAIVALATTFGAEAETHHVFVDDFEFSPNNLVIAPGDTVVWYANAPEHTVTADDGSFDSSPLPEVVTIPAGETFSHTFTKVGVYNYYCRLHGSPVTAGVAPRVGPRSVPDDAMMGIIRVADPSLNTPPQTPVNSTPAAGATGLSNSPLLQATEFEDADGDDSHAASQWLVRLAADGTLVLDTGADTSNLISLRIADLQPNTAYEWQVRYRDDRGEWSEYSTATQFTVAAGLGTGTGLKGTYFAYNAKKDMILKQTGMRIDPVLDFDWGLGKSHPSTPANNFFVYWEGWILPEYSEEYLFRIKADGGVRVWINGQLIIDDFVAAKFAIYRSGSATLESGIPASIRIQYFDDKGAASMHLRWSSISQPLEVVPQTRLFPEL